jgi:hypothetical protein
VEVRVAQPVGSDAIQCRRRDDAAEGGRCTKADVIGQDQQDIRCALWGTIRAGQAAFDWLALRPIWPSNFCGGAGR